MRKGSRYKRPTPRLLPGARPRRPQRKRSRATYPEERLHRAVADWLRAVLLFPAWFTTFPAGGGGRVRGAKLKAMGLQPGMPDILVFAQCDVIGIELKVESVQSLAQQEVEMIFGICGFGYFVCRSIDDVEAALRLRGVRLRIVQGGQDARRHADGR